MAFYKKGYILVIIGGGITGEHIDYFWPLHCPYSQMWFFFDDGHQNTNSFVLRKKNVFQQSFRFFFDDWQQNTNSFVLRNKTVF